MHKKYYLHQWKKAKSKTPEIVTGYATASIIRLTAFKLSPTKPPFLKDFDIHSSNVEQRGIFVRHS